MMVTPVSQTAPKSIPSPIPPRAVVWDMGGTNSTGEDMTEETISLDELTNAELLAVASARQKARDAAIEAWREAESAVFARLYESNATILRGGDYTAEKKTTRSYRWDGETVAKIAPEYCEFVDPKPGYWKVTNTGGLNRLIDKLGNTPEADALVQARQVEEKWSLVLNMTDREKDARIAEMVGRLEGGDR